jgi:hypothetical protein
MLRWIDPKLQQIVGRKSRGPGRRQEVLRVVRVLMAYEILLGERAGIKHGNITLGKMLLKLCVGSHPNLPFQLPSV